MPAFSRGLGPVSAATIDASEKRLGVKFPPDYKRFLRNINGGSPTPDLSFNVPDRCDVMLGIL